MANANSYLRLQMEAGTLERLRGVAHVIAEDVPFWLLGGKSPARSERIDHEVQKHDTAKDEAGGFATDADRPIGFAPQEDLHITHAFFGEALHSHGADRALISGVHRLVEEALSDATLDLDASTAAADDPEEDVERFRMVMELDSFELFPPEKSNLVIARLRFPSRKHEMWARRLYLQVHEACAKAGVKLRGAPKSCAMDTDAAVMENSEGFQPHITLGKIQASAKSIGRVTTHTLNQHLQGTSTSRAVTGGSRRMPLQELADGSVDRGVHISGVSMGGQPPKKVYFDWDSLFFVQ